MKLRPLFFCSFFLIQLSRAGDDPPEGGRLRPTTLSLEEATRAAVANNAAIKASRAKWEMMKARIPQAAAWEDPMAGVDVERFGTTQFGTYTNAEWMLSQKFPLACFSAIRFFAIHWCSSVGRTSAARVFGRSGVLSSRAEADLINQW